MKISVMFYLFLALIIGTIILFFNFKLKSASRTLSKAKREKIRELKKNGIKIEIDVKNCEVIKKDTIIKSNYYEASSIFGLKFLKQAKYNFKDKLQVQSTIICRFKNSKNVEEKLIKHVSMDSSQLRHKMHLQQKITVYMGENNNYIDLDFLNIEV